MVGASRLSTTDGSMHGRVGHGTRTHELADVTPAPRGDHAGCTLRSAQTPCLEPTECVRAGCWLTADLGAWHALARRRLQIAPTAQFRPIPSPRQRTPARNTAETLHWGYRDPVDALSGADRQLERSPCPHTAHRPTYSQAPATSASHSHPLQRPERRPTASGVPSTALCSRRRQR